MTKLSFPKILFFSVLIFSFLLFFPKTSLADYCSSSCPANYSTECGEQVNTGCCSSICCKICCSLAGCFCCGNCIACSCSGTWDEYRCSSIECGGDIQVRHCHSYKGGGPCAMGSCANESCCVSCTAWELYEDCGSWQKCEGTNPTLWGLRKPECKCEGVCIQTPVNDRYYDNPTYSDQPDENKDKNNIFLPVKLDWDDVAGWKDGWDEGGVSKTCSTECVQSYEISIDNTTKNPFSKLLGESEYAPPEDNNSCLLKSDATHDWRTKGCCTTDGNNCGPESSWQFKTNLVPEPVSPYDPDWNGPEYATPTWNEEEIFPVRLDWCDVSKAKSYYMKNYRYAPGEETKTDKTGEDYCLSDFCPTITAGQTARQSPFVLKSENYFSLEEFTKGTLYDWQLSTCLDKDGGQCSLSCPTDAKWDNSCTQLGQKWSFFSQLELLPPEIIFPKGQTVNILDNLQWMNAGGTNSYRYFLWGEWVFPDGTPWTGIWEVPVPSDNIKIPLKDIWKDYFKIDGKLLQFKLNTYFEWWVKSCWSRVWEEPKCEETGTGHIGFYTTGAPPTNSNTDNTIIPVKLDWDNMPGAASYRFEVATDSGFANIVIPESQRVLEAPNSGALVDYPQLRQNTTYWWRVKTCADKEGNICGEWNTANGESFKTFILAKPSNPYPTDGGEFYTYDHYLKWDSALGARFYQYQVDFGGTGKIPLTIVSTNYALVSIEELEVGGYTWKVRACLDKDCNETGDFSGPWSFTLVEKVPPSGGGIVPCGRYANVPDPYNINEREPCQFKHIFLLLRNIIDFVLWKLGLIILVILIIATGVVFHFSMGAPETMAKVKSILESAGKGYAIIILSWTIISIILSILGYRVGVPWWQLQF